MKRTLTLSLLLAGTLSAGAQITLTQSSYASWTPGPDSARSMTGTMPPRSANIMADLSANTYGSYRLLGITTVSYSGMAQATYGYPFSDKIPSSMNNGLTWYSTQARAVTSAGIMAYGEHTDRQSYVLITANTDSFTMVQQDAVYSTPRRIISFPATYGSTWSDSFKYTLNAQLTLAAYAMNHAPMSRITYGASTSSVVGWGKIRVKTASGASSEYIDVIGVKTVNHFRDSLYLGSAPAPSQMLTGFGFTQGAVSSNYTMSWYRAGETTPLLRIGYANDSMTTPTFAETQQRGVPVATSVELDNAASPLLLYPNPVAAGGNLNLVLGAEGGKADYQVLNSLGQLVASGSQAIQGGRISIGLGGNLGTGQYLLRVSQNGRAAEAVPFVVGGK